MPVHKIDLRLPEVDVTGVDIRLVIYSDNERLGRLRISKGTIDWYPKHSSVVRRYTWERFAELMAGGL
jgi:hypothetical protein